MPDAPSILGPFRFRVDPDRAAAFAREIGADEKSVPLSYPAIWIADPKLFDPVRDFCAAAEVVPVHESQSFSFSSPLRAGAEYDVTVTLRREETPPRLILDASIASIDGAPVARSETMLRLVPRAGFGAAA
ncbi:MAG: hypothetical protein ACM3NE_06070 [Hyphomicrobiales bacterium]|jgi:hypothetical protein